MMKIYKYLLIFFLAVAVNEVSAQRYIPKWKIADLQQMIDSSGKPTIINFWASFCKPCLEEMPYFQKAAEKYSSKGLNIVFVSLDLNESYPKKINFVVSKLNISSQVVFLDEPNADAFVPVIDKNWTGAIPATLFINNKRVYKKFIEEELTPKKLEEEIVKLLAE